MCTHQRKNARKSLENAHTLKENSTRSSRKCALLNGKCALVNIGNSARRRRKYEHVNEKCELHGKKSREQRKFDFEFPFRPGNSSPPWIIPQLSFINVKSTALWRICPFVGLSNDRSVWLSVRWFFFYWDKTMPGKRKRDDLFLGYLFIWIRQEVSAAAEKVIWMMSNDLWW